MLGVFLIVFLSPFLCIFWLCCLIRGITHKNNNKSQNNQSVHYIDDEERRINEWGLDDDWRWGKL